MLTEGLSWFWQVGHCAQCGSYIGQTRPICGQLRLLRNSGDQSEASVRHWAGRLVQCHDNWSHVIFQDWQRNGSDPAVDYRTYRSKDKGCVDALTLEIGEQWMA